MTSETFQEVMRYLGAASCVIWEDWHRMSLEEQTAVMEKILAVALVVNELSAES